MCALAYCNPEKLASLSKRLELRSCFSSPLSSLNSLPSWIFFCFLLPLHLSSSGLWHLDSLNMHLCLLYCTGPHQAGMIMAPCSSFIPANCSIICCLILKSPLSWSQHHLTGTLGFPAQKLSVFKKKKCLLKSPLNVIACDPPASGSPMPSSLSSLCPESMLHSSVKLLGCSLFCLCAIQCKGPPMKAREEVVTTMSQQPLPSRQPPCTVCLSGGFPGCAVQPQLHNGATWELLKTPVPRLHPRLIKSKSWGLGISYAVMRIFLKADLEVPLWK